MPDNTYTYPYTSPALAADLAYAHGAAHHVARDAGLVDTAAASAVCSDRQHHIAWWPRVILVQLKYLRHVLKQIQ